MGLWQSAAIWAMAEALDEARKAAKHFEKLAEESNDPILLDVKLS